MTELVVIALGISFWAQRILLVICRENIKPLEKKIFLKKL